MARAAGTALAPVAPVEIGYPSSDGEPVAESSFQLIPLFYAFDALRRRYAGRRAEQKQRLRAEQELQLESAARRRAEARIAELEALLRERGDDLPTSR